MHGGSCLGVCETILNFLIMGFATGFWLVFAIAAILLITMCVNFIKERKKKKNHRHHNACPYQELAFLHFSQISQRQQLCLMEQVHP